MRRILNNLYIMIKLVHNEFFIYSKETRIESNRSFYGSFSLGPFDTAQSLTIANALRRTLLAELKGLAITSAEIEGAFHEYSTLPGVKDSILDILLNLKDIVLKTANYGNKKRGTSYAATFKKTQIGYLKTRGPGIVTASELKLPPGIQCVDPDQYIATLSEEGVLNIKITINEGKNYVIQSSYKPNSNQNQIEPSVGKTGDSQTQKPHKAKTANKLNEIKLTQRPTPFNQRNSNSDELGKVISSSKLRAYIDFKKRRLWLKKTNLLQTPPLFLLRSGTKKGAPQNTQETRSFLSTRSSFTSFSFSADFEKKRADQNIGSVTKIDTSASGSVVQKAAQETERISLLMIKENDLTSQKGVYLIPDQKSHFKSGLTPQHLREGGAVAATKGVALPIDAVFMPVNRVNYIIETNEQSVMLRNTSNTNSISLPSLTPLLPVLSTSSNLLQKEGIPFLEKKNKPLLIFTPVPAFYSKRLQDHIRLRSSSFLSFFTVLSTNTKVSEKEKTPTFTKNRRVFFKFPKQETLYNLKTFTPNPFKIRRSTHKKNHFSFSHYVNEKIGSNALLSRKTKKKILEPNLLSDYFLPTLLPLKILTINGIRSQQRLLIENSLTIQNGISRISVPLGVSGDFSREKKPINKKKTFLKSTAAHNLLVAFSKSELVSKEFAPTPFDLFPLQNNTSTGSHHNNIRLSANQTKIPLKNNIIIEIWTNGSIHPRQALYEACKNLLSVFSKLEKATPLAFTP